ncbi:MAG: tetratricopeptide repeat protein [Kiritimatiellia bacterium]|jgi:tetratricopeptide (TPR) repeat protein
MEEKPALPGLSAGLPAIAHLATAGGGSANGGKFPRIGSRLSILTALATLALAAGPQNWNIAMAAAAPDQSSPAGKFATAYNSMLSADLLDEKGLRTDATDLYAEALELFGKISADYPQWNPDVVAFRIGYCREALQRLQGKEERKAESGERKEESGKRKAESGEPEANLPAPRRFPLREAASAGQVGGQAPEDSLKRTAENGKSEIRNRKSEILDLSPLTFKLQQAAIEERGRDYTGALAMYTALLEEYPREPWALKGACRCCLRLGRMDRARALAMQILALPLPDADLNLLAALVACYDGRYRAAIPLLRQSLKQNRACPETHVALGVALAAIGETKEAQEEMKRALSFNPKLGDAFYNLARLSLRQKPTDHDTPRVHYRLALRNGAAPDPELDKLLAE